MSAQTVPLVVPLADIRALKPCREGFRIVKEVFPHGVPLTLEAVSVLEDKAGVGNVSWAATRLITPERLCVFVRWAAFRSLPAAWQRYQEGELPPLLAALEERIDQLKKQHDARRLDPSAAEEYQLLSRAKLSLTDLNDDDRLQRAVHMQMFPLRSSMLPTDEDRERERQVRLGRLLELLQEQCAPIVRCDRCGVSRREGEGGWLRATRVGDGKMLTRCPRHITRYVVYECGGSVTRFRSAMVNGVAVRIPAPKKKRGGS